MYEHEWEDTEHVIEVVMHRMNQHFCPTLPYTQYTKPPTTKQPTQKTGGTSATAAAVKTSAAAGGGGGGVVTAALNAAVASGAGVISAVAKK